jgi:hypothetical protein
MTAPDDALPRWWDWDPGRLKRDIAEVKAFAPDLTFIGKTDDGPPSGGWIGKLPVWPFERPKPEGLSTLTPFGLEVLVVYSSAHPVIAPVVYPTSPAPTLNEESNTTWHVAPGGSLCLLQSEGLWVPEASIVDLLEKACGWNVEYALMHAGAIESMSTNGIVSDSSLDSVIVEAAQTQATSPTAS